MAGPEGSGAPDGRSGPPPETDVDALADRLEERIHATITMIAVVVGLSAGHVDPTGAFLTVLTAALGLWLAAFAADQQAHRTVRRRITVSRREASCAGWRTSAVRCRPARWVRR